MLILKEIIQNFLLGIPAIKKIAWKFHSTGINNDPEKVAGILDQIKEVTSVTGKNILEIGPGRTDAFLHTFKKQGAENVSGIDVYPYLNSKLLASNGIGYFIYDGKKIPFTDKIFDLIISNDTFEHLKHPRVTCNEIFRILKPGSIAIINIDLRDHYSFGKDQIYTFNCLKYSDQLWNLMSSNRSAFVNRKRYSDWIKLFSDAGFQIIYQSASQSDSINESLIKNKLKYLNKYSIEDATTTNLSVVLKKPV